MTYDYDSVAYTGKTKPVITDQKVTIKYLYEDDSEAAPEYQETYKTGDSFEIASPEIENFIPDYEKITGTVANEDLTYIVRYKAKPVVPDPDPETPDNPDPTPTPTPDPTPTPTPPSENLPNLPTFPGTNLIDGSLLYLAPLGEVAFVPNTGIVSDAVANLFTEDFAEIILSQAFVMIVLLIFASSFATYFTLRKFLMFNPATRSTGSSIKKMPKMAKMNTRGAKSTKTTAKSTRKSSTARTKTARSKATTRKTK